MDIMLSNNEHTNKRSSIKDFLRKINNNSSSGTNRMPVIAPSTPSSIVNKMLIDSKHPSSSQSYNPALPSTMSLNQSVPMSLRQIPCTILDDIRQLHQQKQQFEEMRQEQLQRKHEQLLESNLMAMRSQNLPKQQHQEESLLLESFKKQNAILWECMKRCEDTIKNLEENHSKLTQANARLKAELHDQFKINKNLVQRNTDIVLDTSAKDQQIAVLKEQKKCLSKQNAKLKSFLEKADSYLDSLQSQQYILQQRQEQMQQSSASVDGGGLGSDSKKRKRDELLEGESRSATEGNDTISDRDVITIASTLDEDEDAEANESIVVSDHQ